MNRIQSLIEQAETAQEAELATKKAGLAQAIQDTQAHIRAALGPLWDELEPYLDEGTFEQHNYQPGDAWYIARLPELAPFAVVYRQNNTGYRSSPRSERDPSDVVLNWLNKVREKRYDVPIEDEARVAAFFKQARDYYQQAQAEKSQALIKAQRDRLESHMTNRRAREPEEAEEALGELITLVPENEAEWRELWEKWQAEYDAERAQEERQQAWQQRQDELAGAYKAELIAFWKRVMAIEEENETAIMELQAELDASFDIWWLTYSLIAIDEEYGELLVDTRTVVVFSDESDADGYWTIFEHHRPVRKMRYFNVVSLEGPERVSPMLDSTARDEVCHDFPTGHRRHVYFDPRLDRDQIQARLDAALKPYPLDEEPLPPEDLPRQTAKAIVNQVRNEVG